jgi:hypothetical protein
VETISFTFHQCSADDARSLSRLRLVEDIYSVLMPTVRAMEVQTIGGQSLNETETLPSKPLGPWQSHDCKLGDIGLMYLAYKILSRYCWIPSVILGIPGNLLTIAVAQRRQNRHLSPCIYMTAMAVVDTILLVVISLFLPIFYGKYYMNRRDLQYM